MNIKNRWKTVAIQEDLKELLKKFDAMNISYQILCDGDTPEYVRETHEQHINNVIEDIEAEISNINLYINMMR